MAKGFKGGFGGGNMMRQQQQMQQKIMKMQQDVKEAQEAVEAQVFTASVGGGAVSATVNGKKEMTGIAIKPEAVDPEDVEMLQDLVVAAVNEAMRKADADAASSMQKLTGGLNLGGLL